MPVQRAYIQKTPRLTTPWTSKVSLTEPLKDYPRPQLERRLWQSLNGQWEFEPSSQLTIPPSNKTLAETILVPFPIESALSGIMRHETNSFYRRTFTIPADWAGRHVQLNFGAVTWRATVWINGQNVGVHSGGYDSFSFDITSHLNGGTNEVIVGVYSPVDAEGIPLGKQRLNGTEIWYTAASGIWQTVWLEPTHLLRVTHLHTAPDIHAGFLDLTVTTSGSFAGHTVTAVVSTGDTMVGDATAPVSTNTLLRIPVPNARLWSPEDPFLYNVRVTIKPGGESAGEEITGDEVTSYFGMRSVGTAIVNGWLRPVVNGRFIFQMGTLDQGYWPDGIYTAPTDEALRFDLKRQKDLGFNAVRKHMKIEPARWFYHADQLGLLVFQDMPAMRKDVKPSNSDRTIFEDELRRMIDQHRSITSIVQWNPFNEGWGEYDAARIADLIKSWDGTRLVNSNSGADNGNLGGDPGNGDIIARHIYVGPGNTSKPTSTRVAQLGEFGGLGLPVSGHEWRPGTQFCYEKVADAAALNRRYVEISAQLQGQIWGRGLSGSIYTQPTDVESEVNGFYTYDRQLFKGNFDQFKAINIAVTNSVAWLRPGECVSLGVTTTGYTDRYLSYDVSSLGVISAVSDASSRMNTTFRVRVGLASSSCWSFESRNNPGHYLRHLNGRIQLDKSDSSAAFDADATFRLCTGATKSGVSFESYNSSGKFLRHFDGNVYIASNGGDDVWDNVLSWASDTTWQVASPWWRSGANLTLDARVSLQTTAAGITDRYLRHQNSLAFTTIATTNSDGLTRSDATFIVRPGLADPSCYSFESFNYPGQYLRHSNFRLRIAQRDNSEVFSHCATFRAEPGLNDPSGVTLWSFNLAGHAIRYINGEVWLATSGGPKAYDVATSYAADATWRVATALA